MICAQARRRADRPGTAASAVAAGASVVNDVHSKLNETMVARIVRPTSLEALVATVEGARAAALPLSVAGGRHAMGGQQFAAGATLVDASRLDRVLRFDRDAGRVEVEAGIQWPKLVRFLHAHQPPDLHERAGFSAWAIAQKQTGADRLSIGGALSANVPASLWCRRPACRRRDACTTMARSWRRCSGPSAPGCAAPAPT